jgi:ribosomal-protein-alanine N-acetyltransferase
MTARTFAETPRLILRDWRESDREPWAAMGRDPAVMQHLGPVMTREQADASFERASGQIARDGHGFWAVERKADGAFLGFIGAKNTTFDAHFTPNIELGWRLSRDAWGGGLATEGAMAARDWAFANLDTDEVIAITTPDNHRSQAVMGKIGLERDLAGDFDHPSLAEDDPLRPHVLFRMGRARWEKLHSQARHP